MCKHAQSGPESELNTLESSTGEENEKKRKKDHPVRRSTVGCLQRKEKKISFSQHSSVL